MVNRKQRTSTLQKRIGRVARYFLIPGGLGLYFWVMWQHYDLLMAQWALSLALFSDPLFDVAMCFIFTGALAYYSSTD